MKKIFALILALAMLLSFVACNDSDNQSTISGDLTQATTVPMEAPTDGTEEPTEPTQTPTEEPTKEPTAAPTEKPTAAPTTCSHNWEKATCTVPKICSVCKRTEGKPAGHKFTNGVCSVCKYDSVVNAKENFQKRNYISTTKSGDGLELVEFTWTDEGYWYSSYYYIQGDGDPNDYIDYEGKRYFCAGGGGPYVEYTLTDSYVKFYNKEAEVSVKYALLEDGSLRLIPDANSTYFPTMLLIQNGAPQHSPIEEPAECDHEWSWSVGNCVTPRVCIKCNQTGEVWADMHDWRETPCTAEFTCYLCGATKGEASGHEWGSYLIGWYIECQNGCGKQYECSCGFKCAIHPTGLNVCQDYCEHWQKNNQCCPHQFGAPGSPPAYGDGCWYCDAIYLGEEELPSVPELPATQPPTKAPTTPPPTKPLATETPVTKPPTTKPPATKPPATEPPATDVLIISDTQTISDQVIDTDVYITSTGVAIFNNVTVNGTVYCYGQLTINNSTIHALCAYSLGVFGSCGEFDGIHGKVVLKGNNTVEYPTITDEALDEAFEKWGKK